MSYSFVEFSGFYFTKKCCGEGGVCGGSRVYVDCARVYKTHHNLLREGHIRCVCDDECGVCL